MKEAAWKKAAGCAAMQEETAPEALLEYVRQHADCDAEEAEKVLHACKTEAQQEREEAKLRYPAAAAGVFVGILAAVVNGVICISTGFHWLFLVFLGIALSLIKSGEKYVARRNAAKKAAELWQAQAKENADAALQDMEKLFV